MQQPCVTCQKTVYSTEKIESKGWYHKGCFKCSDSNCRVQLSLKTFQNINDRVWCKAHAPNMKSTAVADSMSVMHALHAPKKDVGHSLVLGTGEKPTIGLDSFSLQGAINAPKKEVQGGMGSHQSLNSKTSLNNYEGYGSMNAIFQSLDCSKPKVQTSATKTSNSSSSTTTARSIPQSWRQNTYHGTIICTVDAASRKFNIRRDKISLLSYDTFAPNGALIRVLTCSLRELLRDLPQNFGMHDVIVKRFPECSENVGSVVNVMGRCDIMIQVYASNETDKVYNCSVEMSDPSSRSSGNEKVVVPVQSPAQKQSYLLSQPPRQHSLQQSPIQQPYSSKNIAGLSRLNDPDHLEKKVTQSANLPVTPELQQQLQHSDEPPHLKLPASDSQFEGLNNDVDEFQAGGAESGTRALAHKPWAGAIVAPSNDADFAKTGLPSESLVLEHVYGYRTRDCRNNLFYTSNGSIVWPAGSVGVVHDIKTNTQRFFHGKHKEDITAVALHPDRKTVATGDVVTHDDGCVVYIWDSENPEDESKHIKLRIGEKKLARGVAAVEFSADGRWLSVVAMDTDHMIYIYDWKRSNKLIAMEKGHNDSIFGLTFNTNGIEFVTYGVKHLTYWTFDQETGRLKGDKGIFGSRKVQSVICAVFLPDGTYITGSHGGELIAWKRNQIISSIEDAHKGPIYGLTFHEEFGIISGGQDGKIILRDNKMQVLDELALEAGVRASCISNDGKSLIVGLADSAIIQVIGFGLTSKKTITKVHEAHSAAQMEELWGLAMNPVDADEFATVGDDNRVFKWSAKERKSLCSTTLEKKLRAVSYSPDGSVLAVGNVEGDIFILQSSDLAQVFFRKYTPRKGIPTKLHGVSVLKFSPDGQYLAVGSHDMVVDLYDVPAGMKLVKTCNGHSSFISHMDWSSCSAFLQTNSGDYELMYWNVASGKQVASPSSMKDVDWASQCCILGWSVQGVWDKGMDGTDVNWVDRNPTNSCLASGDDLLNVRLHSYPAIQENMPCKKYLGHGSYVTKVLFNATGERLVTTGGKDGVALQWLVKKE